MPASGGWGTVPAASIHHGGKLKTPAQTSTAGHGAERAVVAAVKQEAGLMSQLRAAAASWQGCFCGRRGTAQQAAWAFAAVPTRHHPAAIDCPHTSARASRPVPADGDRPSASYHVFPPNRASSAAKKERDKCPPFKLTTRSSERSHRWPRSVSLHDSLLETLTTSSTLSRLLLAY
jgi:hypothetical protein